MAGIQDPETMPWWCWAAPVAAAALLAAKFSGAIPSTGALVLVPAALLLGGAVFAAVHHAEVIALRVGEPFGSIVLAAAVTVIEVALIVSIMLSAPDGAPATARDTVFAAIMIVLNGIVGLCLLAGGMRHHEQGFRASGATGALGVLGTLATLVLILPNYTLTTPGPAYAPSQLVFVAIVSLALYGLFLFVQTVRHRSYFLEEGDGASPHALPSSRAVARSAGLLLLLPEGLASYRAAQANRLQTSLNLALGSSLATIGLTIPAVTIVSLAIGVPLVLGLQAGHIVLLVLSLFASTLTLAAGRSTVLQGGVHLVIFAAFLVISAVP